ncbi:MAG: sulfurtransferase TusA family protein [Methylophilus sp.]|jgi:tRNA 2-thiouridine synthesizing protein A|nr:sulfurtransferase TusA family protein [Methylophilus sp.]MDP3607621.1 sulfurtransferase TusA family protein [Methylophilus sp.]
MDFDKEVDAKNLNCPLPILRCKKGLNELLGNQVLKIMATDPGSVKDFEAFCKQTGHTLLQLDQTDKVFTFYIKKRNDTL